MKRHLAALMLLLWCVGMTDAALGHVHLWLVGPDGHSHVTHVEAYPWADTGQARLDLIASETDPQHVKVAVASDDGMAPVAVSASLPSKTLLSPLMVPALSPLHHRPAAKAYFGRGPPGPAPGFLEQHRTIVLLR